MVGLVVGRWKGSVNRVVVRWRVGGDEVFVRAGVGRQVYGALFGEGGIQVAALQVGKSCEGFD